MRKATEVFGEWAENGKDEGMEKGHAAACPFSIPSSFPFSAHSPKTSVAFRITYNKSPPKIAGVSQ